MVALFFLCLALAMGEVSARGSRRDTTLATFNAGLLATYPETEERASILIDQIVKSDVDIFCLQEVWYADMQKQIYRGVKDYYPYILSAVDLTDDTVSSEPACTLEMLNPAIECQRNVCSAFTADPVLLGLCWGVRCLEEVSGASEPCLICIDTSQGNIPLCLSESVSRYEKTYGLMILSTKELMNPMVQGHNNQSQQRGILTASVDGVGDLMCTHLTNDRSSVGNTLGFGDFYIGPPLVFPPLYPSYVAQQYDEVLRIFDFATKVDLPIIMGDFNHGPAAPGGITWRLPFLYGLMSSRGFYSPYILQDGRCTWCVENAQAASVVPTNFIYDHTYITTNTMERVRSVKRMFDDVFTESGVRLSDHFGIKMTLSNVRTNCSPSQECRFFCESEIEKLLPLQAPDPGQFCVP